MSRYATVTALALGILAGPMAASSSAAPCPPGYEWDPIQHTCILIGTH
jgi:hypothetical protein